MLLEKSIRVSPIIRNDISIVEKKKTGEFYAAKIVSKQSSNHFIAFYGRDL